MICDDNSTKHGNAPTRRQLVTGLALGFGSLAVGAMARGNPQDVLIKEAHDAGKKTSSTRIHEEIDFNVVPQRIYDALLSSRRFAALSGMPAQIDRKEGGAFSMFGGMIVGRNVELISGQRIVQAWRPASWTPGDYSIVHFEIKPKSQGSTLVLDHAGFPEDDFDSLSSGWHTHYFDALRKYLV